MKLGLAVISFLCFSCHLPPSAVPSSSSNPYWIQLRDIRMISSDQLHYLYIVNSDDKIIQLDSNGHQLHEVTYKTLGRVHNLDTDNPFKLFVFYRDQQTIVYLDNTLSELRRIELKDWQLHDVTTACLGAENSIWLFDGTARVMKKYDDHGHLLILSDPFEMYNVSTKRPDWIQDIDHRLILREWGKPAVMFNDFGVFIRELPAAIGDKMVIYDGSLLYPEGESILRYEVSDNHINPHAFNNAVCDRCFFLPYNGQMLIIDAQGILRRPMQFIP